MVIVYLATLSKFLRMPADAPIRHYTVDERIAYDADYGEGAYDAWKADMLWKDGVNRDGGYYKETGMRGCYLLVLLRLAV